MLLIESLSITSESLVGTAAGVGVEAVGAAKSELSLFPQGGLQGIETDRSTDVQSLCLAWQTLDVKPLGPSSDPRC